LESLKENRTHKNIKVIEFRNVSTQRYDVVFIDAPCSGTGTFRRQPDLKYNVRIKEVDEKMEIQKDLLEKSIKLLKENGIIILLLKDLPYIFEWLCVKVGRQIVGHILSQLKILSLHRLTQSYSLSFLIL
jgi:hypothetical protein